MLIRVGILLLLSDSKVYLFESQNILIYPSEYLKKKSGTLTHWHIFGVFFQNISFRLTCIDILGKLIIFHLFQGRARSIGSVCMPL